MMYAFFAPTIFMGFVSIHPEICALCWGQKRLRCYCTYIHTPGESLRPQVVPDHERHQEDDHTRVLNAPDRMSKRTTRQIESMLHTRSLAFRRRRTPRSLVRSLARLLKVKHLQRRPRSFSRSKLGRTLSLFSRPFSSLLGNRPAPPGEGPAITRTATARRIRVGKDN